MGVRGGGGGEGEGEGEGGRCTSEKVRGALVHKRGLQSINSIKH